MNTTIKTLFLAAALAGALFGGWRTADASHAALVVVGPAQLTVGDAANVRAVLHSADDGLPIVGATVTFYMEASFGGVDGEAVLGRAVTDKEGVAALPYEPKSAGEHRMRVEYLTPGVSEPEEAIWVHSVSGTSGQLYHSTAGVPIPQLNVWLLMAIVGAVWAILLSIALRVVAIAHAGSSPSALARQRAAVGGAAHASSATRPDATGGR